MRMVTEWASFGCDANEPAAAHDRMTRPRRTARS